VQNPPPGAFLDCLVESAAQYAIYVLHAGGGGWNFGLNPGNYSENLSLTIPKGDYIVEWVNPENGTVMKSDELNHKGGTVNVQSPQYKLDIALSIKKPGLQTPADNSRRNISGVFICRKSPGNGHGAVLRQVLRW
jgi:hypothetical protein